jgi:hypothetical protein
MYIQCNGTVDLTLTLTTSPPRLRLRDQRHFRSALPSFLPASKHNRLHAFHNTDSPNQPLGDDDGEATGEFLAHVGRLSASASPAAGLNRTPLLAVWSLASHVRIHPNQSFARDQYRVDVLPIRAKTRFQCILGAAASDELA